MTNTYFFLFIGTPVNAPHFSDLNYNSNTLGYQKKNKMPSLLFSLRGVPDDEANEIRELLDVQEINYYETSAGNWGISMPALWLTNADELEKAHKLLNEYHTQRAATQKENYQQLKQDKRFIDVMTNKPIKVLTYLAAIAFILYLYVRMLSEFGL